MAILDFLCLVGDRDVDIERRGCLTNPRGIRDACASDKTVFREVLRDLGSTYQDANIVNHEICFCSGDLCDPSCPGSTNVLVGASW